MKKVGLIFFTTFLLSTAVESLHAMELLPTSLKKIFHLIIEPEDLYDPVIQAPFNFWEKGYRATYNFNVKYSDTYAISIDCEKGQNCIPSGWGTSNKYHFKGKLVADFFHKETLVLSREIDGEEAVFYQDGNMDFLDKIILLSINVPIKKI